MVLDGKYRLHLKILSCDPVCKTILQCSQFGQRLVENLVLKQIDRIENETVESPNCEKSVDPIYYRYHDILLWDNE